MNMTIINKFDGVSEFFIAQGASPVHEEKTIELLTAIKAAKGFFIDEHMASVQSVEARTRNVNKVLVCSVISTKDGRVVRQEVCPAYESEMYFSVNPLFVGKDGKVHLSTCAVGQVVETFRHEDLEAAIQAINEKGRMFNPIHLELVDLSV